MQKIKGWNRNIQGGKRPHRKIQRYGQYANLSDRLIAEVKAYEDYVNRTQKPK